MKAPSFEGAPAIGCTPFMRVGSSSRMDLLASVVPRRGGGDYSDAYEQYADRHVTTKYEQEACETEKYTRHCFS